MDAETADFVAESFCTLPPGCRPYAEEHRTGSLRRSRPAGPGHTNVPCGRAAALRPARQARPSQTG